MHLKTLFIILTLSILFCSCDKNKRVSKRLFKPGSWELTELSVNGNNIVTNLPKWVINNCEIYDETCSGEWHYESDVSEFYWQFNDKANTFTLSRVVDPANCEDFYTAEVEQQTYHFSGEYKVIEHKRKSMTFESYQTFGFEGEKVVIKIKRE
ncbi:MAG: hypothetical protein WEA99_02805 [Brumimicrobium sp.]